MPETGIFGSIRDALFGHTQSNAVGVQLAEMADARQGALYFLGNTEFVPYPKPFSVTSSVLTGMFGSTVFLEDISTLSSKLTAKAGELGSGFAQGLASAGGALGEFAHKIDEQISTLFMNVLNKLASVFGRYSETIREKLRSLSPSILGAIAGKIIGLIPGWSYVKSASAIYQGARQAVSSVYTFFSQVWSGYDVELLGGHPSIIANAMARHSLASAACGAKNAAIETTTTALTITGDLAGMAGTIVSVLKTVLTAVINFIEGAVQKYLVKKTLKEAEEDWKIRESSRSMIYNHEAFSRWFQKAVIPCPVLAAITLNSGFVAHPYRFLKLLDADNTLKSEADFAKGTQHINKLKKISKDYITSYVKEYEMRFSGKDALVSARLNDVILGKAYPTPPPVFATKPVQLTKTGNEGTADDWENLED
ncbi:hypothetical protein [Endozoicomonas sp. OPT23]|uniref:hypothetical protein n=1 Tax=Endozoicomonas sp. OPT23 TaxID=2072845 RepID=UPI0018912D5D|nr:hypothetical protein [Endozoicomonas sp. OPT23]